MRQSGILGHAVFLVSAAVAMVLGCSDDGPDDDSPTASGGTANGTGGSNASHAGATTMPTGTGGSAVASGGNASGSNASGGIESRGGASAGGSAGTAGGATGGGATGGFANGGNAGAIGTGGLGGEAGKASTAAGVSGIQSGGAASNAGMSNAGMSSGGAATTQGGTATGGNSSAGKPNGGFTAGTAGNDGAGRGAAGAPVGGVAGAVAVAGAAGRASPPTCGAELRQSVTLSGARLVIMLDKSGSMGVDPNGNWDNNATRWMPVTQGLEDFFANANRTAQASLEIFPAPGNKTTTCQADYETPLVAMRPLPDPSTFAGIIDGIIPAGGTPMLSAVMGAIAYAKSIEAAEPPATAVVVLITDGEPAIYNSTTGSIDIDCAPAGSLLTNTIPDIVLVTNAAYRGIPPIRTYVIGVGQQLASLSEIASAGGTTMLDTSDADPALTRQTIANALSAIANGLASCSLAYPKAAQGFAVEPNLVNLELVSGATSTALSRSTGCSGGGWYYDNAANPQLITLCPATCQAVTAGATVNLVVGCPARVAN